MFKLSSRIFLRLPLWQVWRCLSASEILWLCRSSVGYWNLALQLLPQRLSAASPAMAPFALLTAAEREEVLRFLPVMEAGRVVQKKCILHF